MSDWDDDEWNEKPQKIPALAQYAAKRNDDDWGEEPKAKQHVDNYSRNGDNRRSSNAYMDAGNDGGDQLSFTINKSNVGLVIGRGGSKIKELEQRYHVKLNIGKMRK